MTVVFMFPGQSSRYPALMDRIIKGWPPAKKIVANASEILSRDLQNQYQGDINQQFKCNQDIQVGVFLASYLYQMVLSDNGIFGDLSLGQSLGEYNHLVHIGALDFHEALKLVDTRGRIYDQGPYGMMASIFPLPQDELESYLQHVRHQGVVQIANFNSPSQNVIAGDRLAVEAAIELIDSEDLGVQIVVIERSIPMHVSIFEPAAKNFLPHLENTNWQQARLPYIPNVLAEILHHPEKRNFVSLLEQHVFNPVQWRASIDLICERYQDLRFVEVGPGHVLFNLLQKSWHKVRKYKIDDKQDLASHLPTLITELSNVT